MRKIHVLNLKIAVYFSADDEEESYGTILQKFDEIGNLKPLELSSSTDFWNLMLRVLQMGGIGDYTLRTFGNLLVDRTRKWSTPGFFINPSLESDHISSFFLGDQIIYTDLNFVQQLPEEKDDANETIRDQKSKRANSFSSQKVSSKIKLTILTETDLFEFFHKIVSQLGRKNEFWKSDVSSTKLDENEVEIQKVCSLFYKKLKTPGKFIRHL